MRPFIIFIILFYGLTIAWIPTFEKAGTIMINGTAQNFSFPSPGVYDWSGDGNKDLFVGIFGIQASIYYFVNEGTNEAPEFSSSSFLEANGQAISFPPS